MIFSRNPFVHFMYQQNVQKKLMVSYPWMDSTSFYIYGKHTLTNIFHLILINKILSISAVTQYSRHARLIFRIKKQALFHSTIHSRTEREIIHNSRFFEKRNSCVTFLLWKLKNFWHNLVCVSWTELRCHCRYVCIDMLANI